MIILVINAGSSSLKYQLIDMDNENVLAKGNCDRIGIDGNLAHKSANGENIKEEYPFPTHKEAFLKLVEVLTVGKTAVIESLSEISAVGHRVVHGGEKFSETMLADAGVIDDIDNLAELAPVHNHAHAIALRACKEVFPENVPQVAVFDTAFHQTIPRKAYMYALPYEYYKEYGVRKYGFHGTSHRFVSSEITRVLGKKPEDMKIVTCHLGNGSSICCVNGGKSVDTSMGFTPLDGMIMGTRCGEVDASAVTYLSRKLNLSPSEMDEILNKKSGFIGVSGISSDNRDISKACGEGNLRAQITCEILYYRIKKYIGAYAAVMNGLDCIVFTGGIGENDPAVRANSCHDLEFFGVEIDDEVNAGTRGELCRISKSSSNVEVWVVPTNEELLIARDTKKLVCGK